MVYKVYTNQTNIDLATNIVLIDDRTCVNFLFSIYFDVLHYFNHSFFKVSSPSKSKYV